MDIANLAGPEVFMSRVVMEFKAKTETCFRKIGNMSATDIEERVAEYVNTKLYENDFDAEIIGGVISGSRCRGLECKTGTLEEYLPGVEKYLEEKAMRMEKKPSVTADLQSKKMQVAGEKKKETKRDCKKSETVI